MLDVGDTLKNGRWRLDARIGVGGVAVIFAASHRNGQRAAIKILKEQFCDHAELCERFLREGYAANAVGHPGVVTVLDDDVERGYPYLVMELLEGLHLGERARKQGGKIPLPELLEVTNDLLSVLQAAHAKEVIHRDIKPANLFVTNEKRLKVLDFGFAKVKLAAAEALTGVGSLLGTPGFISPERLVDDGTPVDGRSDLWSVGATLFRLATGKSVFGGLPAHAVLEATKLETPRSIAEVDPSLPRDFVALVDKALARSVEDRWQSAAEMAEALRELMDDEPTRVDETGSPFGAIPSEVDLAISSEVKAAAEAASRPKARSSRSRSSRSSRSRSASAPVKLPRLHDDGDDSESLPGRRADKTKLMPTAPPRPAASAQGMQAVPAPSPALHIQPPATRAPLTRDAVFTVAMILFVVLAIATAIAVR